MGINRSQLKFHETFQPESGYIAKILDLASNNYCGSKYDISDTTGIPTGRQKGKVEPHIKYAIYMGLISGQYEKGKYSLSLTKLGNEVFIQDRYLHEHLSKWLCHYNISRKVGGAPQWSFLINEANSGFIQGLSINRLVDLAENYFGFNMTFEEAFGVVKRSYIDGFFSDLGYLYIDESNEEFRFNEISMKEELLFVYAYSILDAWHIIFPEKAEITLIELLEDLSFGKIFGLNDESVDEVLEALSDENILQINRQLFPATIIRTNESLDLLSDLYSKLL